MPIKGVTSKLKLYERVVGKGRGEVNALGVATRTFYTRDQNIFIEQMVNQNGDFLTKTQKDGRAAKTIKKTVVSDKAAIFEVWDKLKHTGKHITRVMLSPDSYIQRELEQISEGTVANKGVIMIYKKGQKPIELCKAELNGSVSPTRLLNDGFIKKYSKSIAK